MEQKCRACGTLLEDDSIFCHHCGCRISENDMVLIADDGKHDADSSSLDFDSEPIGFSQPLVDVCDHAVPSAAKISKNAGSGSRIRMVILTAVAVVLITFAGFFGIEQQPDRPPADLLNGFKTNSPDKGLDSNKGVPTASSVKGGSSAPADIKPKPKTPPPSPLTSADITILKQAVIRSHAEYMKALTSKSPATDQKRNDFKAAVAKLDSGLQSYYVAGKKGTPENARKELNTMLTALSGAKTPEVKTTAQVNKTTPVKPVTVIKKAPVKVVKPVKSPTPSKVAVKNTKIVNPKPVTKKIVSNDQLFYQKQLASGAYKDYMNAAGHNDPIITKKRAIYKSNVARLGHSLYVYYVTDKRGTLAQAKQEMRIFLIDLEGTASPAMIQDINQGVSTVK